VHPWLAFYMQHIFFVTDLYKHTRMYVCMRGHCNDYILAVNRRISIETPVGAIDFKFIFFN